MCYYGNASAAIAFNEWAAKMMMK